MPELPRIRARAAEGRSASCCSSLCALNGPGQMTTGQSIKLCPCGAAERPVSAEVAQTAKASHGLHTPSADVASEEDMRLAQPM